MSRHWIALALSAALAMASPAALAKDAAVGASMPSAARSTLRLMTYNIRLGVVDDGENHWNLRRGMLFDLVRRYDADVIGLQEAHDFQIEQIMAAVPGYAVVGVGREDGYSAGEFSALLVRTDRFRIAESGTFWLSDAPATPNSKTWGNNVTRICTWARLIDRQGGAFYVYNMHLDHEAQGSRELATASVRQRVASRTFAADPAIVMGDFNSGEDNAALANLVGPGRQGPWRDSFRIVHPKADNVATFNNFIFGHDDPRKIDYILVPQAAEVLAADILRDSRDRKYPSDHFPVVTEIQLPARR